VDVIAHGLWAGAAGSWLARRHHAPRGALAWTVALGVAPDLLQLVPVLAWSATQAAPVSVLYAHVAAAPGSEPAMPAIVEAFSHHAHCFLHSAIVAGIVTAMLWRWWPGWLIPMSGWWLHIAIDVPTHSDDYYPVPFLYPLTYWGFDGVAWTRPWVLALNYIALALVYAALARSRVHDLRTRGK